MIDFDTPEGRWFRMLSRELHNRRTGRVGGRKWSRQMVTAQRIRPPLQVLDDYRHGDPPLRPDIHSGWKPYVRQFMRMGRLNQADLIITSTSNRLQLRDFRTSAANDELGDVEARKIMRANRLKVVSREVHDMALTMGEAYALVTPPSGKRKHSLITAEDPRQMIVAKDPATGEPIAGLKLFRNEWDDEDLAYLYLPGIVRMARLAGRTSITNGPHRLDARGWTFDDTKDQDVPDGVLPVVPFTNRDGVGEFERHLDTLDRINDKIFDEWWIAKIQAFRQRAVKNLPETREEVDPETGVVHEVDVEADEYDDMFTAAPDQMWQVPGDVEFWESSPVDLTPITNAVEKDRQRLASTTQTPLHTVTPEAASGSAEGASLLREEHTFKCEDRRDRFDPSWATVMSYAFLFQGDSARADVTEIDAQWAPVVRHSLAEKGSAAAQAKDSLPIEVIRRDIWQYEPSEVQEMRIMDGRDLIANASRGNPAADR